ncbi:ABC transporter permease [Thermophilibacter mediterraneus]|uniref:ABC transporter permease n=1 Tax=Thermophilibacter mediterraneus TaxID=1871031 RepID=UPI00320A1C84
MVGGGAPGAGVLTRFTLRSLAANRVRTVVTVVGIALATGLLTAVLTSVSSLRAALVDQVRASEGVWQLSFDYTDAEKVDELRSAAGEHLDRLALVRDLGAAALSVGDTSSSGTYLGVLTAPVEQGGTSRAAGDDAFEVRVAPQVTDGRMPERPGEIALPDYLRGKSLVAGESSLPGVASGASSDGEIELGSTVTLALGRRVLPEGGSSALASGSSPWGTYDEDGELVLEETLVDVGAPRSFSVVGFVSTDFEFGNVALVSADEPAATASEGVVGTAYLSTTGYASTAEMDDLMGSLALDGWRSNTYLLMYQGLEGGRVIFDSLTQFAAVLAVVIVVAAVSLISNAFTISISERTRQFGLLSSLGASRRQLRGTVLVEAAALGALGVPLGLALGIGGAAAAFALTADGWSLMVGSDVLVGLVVPPSDVALAVGLSVLTLLASAFLPALRASRVSAVDAIRQARDVRPSRRLGRTFARRRSAADDLSPDLRRPRGLAARVGGMPAFLARRTLLASAGKSRVAAAALAVSVALLITAGLVSDYLTSAVGYLDYAGSSDVEVYVSAEDPTGTAADAPVAHMNEAAATLSRTGGVERASVVSQATAGLHVDPSAVDWDDVDAFNADSPFGSFSIDGSGYGSALVEVVDDGTWRTLAAEVGLSGDAADPRSLSCVVLNAASTTNDQTYGTVSPLTGAAGSLGLVVQPELARNQWLGMSDDGVYGVITTDDASYQTVSFTPAGEAGLEEVSVPVAAYVDDLGESFPLGTRSITSTNQVILVMPASATLSGEAAGALTNVYSTYLASFADGADEDEVIAALEEAASSLDGVVTGGSYNIAEGARQSRAMTYTVNVFLYCFIAITMAIAVANVFNTIASGLMLRGREFAVLQSVGMGRGALRRMIVLECADFAAKGLVGGIALAALVNVALFQAMSLSIATLALSMPWEHVALSVAVVVAVLAASAAYALRKTHALNLVEALRSDVM